MTENRTHRQRGADDVTSEPGEHALFTNGARSRLADRRDDVADERDAAADRRDEIADARDVHADVRDQAQADQPDLAGTRQFAAQDRHAASVNRQASAEDRSNAREGRLASRWDRPVAEQIKGQVLVAIDDADKLPEATLHIGLAQGMLVNTYGGTAGEALIDIADRADRDESGLEEAARRVMDDGAPSCIRGIRQPAL